MKSQWQTVGALLAQSVWFLADSGTILSHPVWLTLDQTMVLVWQSGPIGIQESQDQFKAQRPGSIPGTVFCQESHVIIRNSWDPIEPCQYQEQIGSQRTRSMSGTVWIQKSEVNIMMSLKPKEQRKKWSVWSPEGHINIKISLEPRGSGQFKVLLEAPRAKSISNQFGGYIDRSISNPVWGRKRQVTIRISLEPR